MGAWVGETIFLVAVWIVCIFLHVLFRPIPTEENDANANEK